MPYDETTDDSDLEFKPKSIKNNSLKESMLKTLPKKPTLSQLETKAKEVEKNLSEYKKQAAKLSLLYKKAVLDKTLPQNKNVLMQETEQDILNNMVQLAVEVNNDPNEQEGMGSLMWIILLLKTCLAQRDQINLLEHEIFLMKKNKGNG